MKYWKLAVCALALGYCGCEKVPAKAENIVSESSPAENIEKYAHVIPSGETDHGKPFFYYIGQTHRGNEKYVQGGEKSQVQIFHVLRLLYSGSKLCGVFNEGTHGKHKVSAESRQVFQDAFSNASDETLEKLLKRKPEFDGSFLLMLATDFDSSYGFHTEESEKLLIESVEKKDMEIARYFIDKLDSARKKEMDIVLDYDGVVQAYEAFKSEIETWDLITKESIDNTLSLADDLEGNIAVVAGIAHMMDVMEMDKKGMLKKIHDKYNLVFVVPNFDWPINDKITMHRKELESYFPVVETVKKAMEQKGLNTIRFNLRNRAGED